MEASPLTTVQEEIRKVLIGKEQMTELVMAALVSSGHVLFEDVPGTGKTMFVKTLARILDTDFSRIQFTPDLLPGDVTGIQFYNQKTNEFEVKFGPVTCNLLLADEINRATPRTQSSLLEVMEERQMTIDGKTYPLPDPFFVFATQNPIESGQGTFSLPEAQLDRFLMVIDSGYPDINEEREMLRLQRGTAEPIDEVDSVLSPAQLKTMQQEAAEVTLSEDVEAYLLDIVQATRTDASVETGISPRGTIAFMKSAQALALLHERSYVVPHDLKRLALPVLAHRLVLTLEGSFKQTKRDVMATILEKVEVPVEAEVN
ncbi:AAA family ATPase [Salsuginibacillus kocurii]|uniref:AAA family ATPase n=1 Tax=Salsuginibacillus kocurii TaxID=427078 RepID=UPI0003748CF3|nr:MoxR family ATPase [Salsuginibacillus kocurii]